MNINCPICGSESIFFCSKKDRFGGIYQYFKCSECRFLFEGDLVMNEKELRDRLQKTYQKDYFETVDTGWKIRGDKTVALINKFLKIYKSLKFKKNLSVLDYGGGTGYITSKISKDFNVFYYDKYSKPVFLNDNYKILEKPEKEDFLYAVEVVEHIVNINEWDFFAKLSSGIIFFTTELSDGITDAELMKWWYLNPDAGHTAIYSMKSLYLIAKKYGFFYFFFPSKSFHFFLKSSFLGRFDFSRQEYKLYNFFRRIKHIIRQ